MFNPAQIRDIISENNLRINKRFGQNFLIDKRKRDRIISLCGIKSTDKVLEIGPGLGALTESILPKCAELRAVEKDRGLAAILKGLYKREKNLKVITADILKYAMPGLPGRVKVIGNLPYYITTPIIFHLLAMRERIGPAFITVQKELAQRILSRPGTGNYGILSLSVQYYCRALKLCAIPKGCFFPAPLVDSVFLQLQIRKEPLTNVKDEELLFKLIRAGFNQRRKTLFNALKKASLITLDKDVLREAFGVSGLHIKARPESLGIEDFASLSDALSSLHV